MAEVTRRGKEARGGDTGLSLCPIEPRGCGGITKGVSEPQSEQHQLAPRSATLQRPARGTRDKGHGDPLPIWGLGAAPSGLSIPLQPPPPRGPPLGGPPPFVPGRARGLQARGGEGGRHRGEEPAKIWGRAHLSLPAEPDVRGRCAALRGGSARGRHTKAAAPLRAPGECGPDGVPRPPKPHPHPPGGGRRGVMG